MANHNSKQIIQYDSQGHAPLAANEYYGRVRIATFSFQASAQSITGTIAQNDSVNFCVIPAGARVVGGKFAHGAFGASVVLSLGLQPTDGTSYLNKDNTVVTDGATFSSNQSIATAGSKDVITTTDLAKFGFVSDKETWLTGLFTGADPADNILITGFVLFVVD